MVKPLREAKAKLSELVRAASRGEDVVISVRGEPKVRLVPVPPKPREISAEERKKWVEDLRELQKSTSTGKPGLSTQQILDELREDRI